MFQPTLKQDDRDRKIDQVEQSLPHGFGMHSSKYFGAQRDAEGEKEDDARNVEVPCQLLREHTGRQSNGNGQASVHVVDI